MRPPKTLLDTDILSMLMKGESSVLTRASEYLTHYPHLSFSIVTKYEICRGLKAKSAHTQLAKFEIFCQHCKILPLSGDVVDVASDIYAVLHQNGELIGDADILIAATAINSNLLLSTNNVRHFDRITGLVMENWREDP